MADEVEIVNVGGEGVASEVTLQKLVDAMDRLAGQKNSPEGKAAKDYAKAQKDAKESTDKHTESVKESDSATKRATSTVNKFTSALTGAIGGIFGTLTNSVLGLGNALLGSATDITSFSEHIPILGALFRPFSSYLDNTIQGFRDLSSVGASFGNDLENVRRSAANLELGFDEFQRLVMNQSENFAALGGSVTQGAARFQQMNRNLKATGDFAALKNMGFTVEEINEGMGDYIDLQRGLGRLQGRSTQELADGSANYLKQIDLLAKVTGKSREEAERALRAQTQDAAIRTLLNQFEEGSEQFNNLQMSLGLLDEIGGSTAMALKGMLTGNPTEEAGQLLAMLGDAGPSVLNAMEAIGQGADPSIMLEAFRNAGGELEQFAGADARTRARIIQQMRADGNPMADFLDASVRLIDIGNRDLDAARAEQDKRNAITESLTTFDDRLREVRANIARQLLDSGLFDKLAGFLSSAVDGFAELVNSEGFKTGVKTFMTMMSEGFTAIGDFFTNWKKYDFATALFGKEAEFDEFGNQISPAVDGLIGDISTILSNAFDAVKPHIVTMLEGVWSGLGEFIDWDKILGGALLGLAAYMGTALLAAAVGWPLLIGAAIIGGILAVFGIDKVKEALSGAWESFTGFFSSVGDWWDNLDFMQPLSAAWETIKGFFSFGEGTGFSISQLATDAWETVKGWFSFGEGTGFSISQLANDAWETVKGWFSFGESSFSITQLATDAWETVKGFFSFGESSFSITQLATDAWESVKAWFSFGTDVAFSIAQLGIDAWATVVSWFGFGDGTGFSISELATDAWNTVTSWFGFGETSFSISEIASTMWNTVTSWFSFDGLEIPSISSMFQGIIDAVKGFFTFDFEMPNFKQYLPTWLGGEGKSLFDSNEEVSTSSASPQSSSEPITIDPSPAVVGTESLLNAQSAMASFATIENLQSNLDILKNGLDVTQVRQYTSSMENLVEVLRELNEELSKDNKFGPGTGENAGSVLARMGSNTTSGLNSDQVNTLLQNILTVLAEMRDIDLDVARNTGRFAGNNLALGGTTVLG